MKRTIPFLIYTALAAGALANPALTKPIAGENLVFEEVDGYVAVEAEHFFKQELDDVRAWYLTTADKERRPRAGRGSEPHWRCGWRRLPRDPAGHA